jgi:hypothetical protein
MRGRYCFETTVVTVACSWGLLIDPVHAESDTREVAAEARFVEGVRQMKEGDCVGALVSFHESQRLSPASGTLLDIAYCEAELGHLASAWLGYRQALSLADATGKTEHAKLAGDEAAGLEPKLAWLSFHFSGLPQRWQLRLDGENLAPDLGGGALPIDPGEHALSGLLGGKERLQRPLNLRPGERQVIEINEPAPDATPRHPGSSARAGAGQVHGPPPVAASRASSGAAAAALTIAGGATLALGLGLFVHARYRYDNADCPDDRCLGAPRDTRLSARTEGFVSYGVAGVGAAVLGLGTVLFLSSTPDAPKHGHQGRLLVGDSRTPWSVAWQARF